MTKKNKLTTSIQRDIRHKISILVEYCFLVLILCPIIVLSLTGGATIMNQSILPYLFTYLSATIIAIFLSIIIMFFDIVWSNVLLIVFNIFSLTWILIFEYSYSPIIAIVHTVLIIISIKIMFNAGKNFIDGKNEYTPLVSKILRFYLHAIIGVILISIVFWDNPRFGGVGFRIGNYIVPNWIVDLVLIDSFFVTFYIYSIYVLIFRLWHIYRYLMKVRKDYCLESLSLIKILK